MPAGSGPLDVVVSGTQASSTANNLVLTATIQGVLGSGVTAPFSVVGVIISMKTSGQPASDDAKGSVFLQGAARLGAGTVQFPPNTGPQQCAEGVELIGIVSPSNYSGQITLRRRFASSTPPGELYVEQDQYQPDYFTPARGHGPGQDDTSIPQLLDNDPQSGGSGGKVYDLDAPGTNLPGPNIYRYRANFVQYAVLGDQTQTLAVSPDFPWWARVSCTQDALGNLMLSTDANISNDNQAGIGTTPITWDLK